MGRVRRLEHSASKEPLALQTGRIVRTAAGDRSTTNSSSTSVDPGEVLHGDVKGAEVAVHSVDRHDAMVWAR